MSDALGPVGRVANGDLRYLLSQARRDDREAQRTLLEAFSSLIREVAEEYGKSEAEKHDLEQMGKLRALSVFRTNEYYEFIDGLTDLGLVSPQHLNFTQYLRHELRAAAQIAVGLRS